jgi:hypothetical protein
MLLIPIMLLTVATAGCDNDEEETGARGTTSGTTTGAGTTGATTTTTGTGGGMNNARVQLAHLSPDAPAVDVCVRGGAGAFQGPLLREQFQDQDGLQYGEVTGYITLPARTYTIRLVAPGSTGCETAIPGITDVQNVNIESQHSYVVAALGEIAPVDNAQPFKVRAIPGVAEPSQGKSRIRAINAVPDEGAVVDVGTTENGSFAPLFTDVKFGEAGQANGKPYVDRDPNMSADLSVRLTGPASATVTATADLAPGAIITVYAIGNASGSPKQVQLLLCTDTGEHGAQGLADCTITP